MNNNAKIVMFPGLKPRVLQGKDGALSLPANVDFRAAAPEKAERAAGEAFGSPPADHPFRVSRPGRPRSLRPLAILIAAPWVILGVLWALSRWLP